MEKLRVVFMGTPEFAVPCLAALQADEGCEVIGVYTQPDKPRGRGQKLLPSPVKAWAEGHGLPVYQPVRIKTPEAVAELKSLKPDLVVVVAFGQILSQEILDIPPKGCINVHGSLLPRYRGAAPMQWCVINGEKKTGITTMMMDAGLDTGDMLLKEELIIGPDMTLEEVHDSLMEMGASVLMKTIAKLLAGTLERIPQEGESNYAPMLTKETGHIDWKKPAQEIHNLVRGLNSWPGAYTSLEGQKFKIWRTRNTGETAPADMPVGTIILTGGSKGMKVATGDGKLIEILELQAPGKKKMETDAYLHGHGLPQGSCFV